MKEAPHFRSRLLIGAVAGFAGTTLMTAAMSRLYRRLPERDRYPLTPREIIDSASNQASVPLENEAAIDLTIAGHFAYGAAAGSLIGVTNPRIGVVEGALAGVAVWAASYVGWIPGVGLLKPATAHPGRRNLLMITAHLAWGAATALSMKELMLARATILRPGESLDAPPAGRRDQSI